MDQPQQVIMQGQKLFQIPKLYLLLGNLHRQLQTVNTKVAVSLFPRIPKTPIPDTQNMRSEVPVSGGIFFSIYRANNRLQATFSNLVIPKIAPGLKTVYQELQNII